MKISNVATGLIFSLTSFSAAHAAAAAKKPAAVADEQLVEVVVTGSILRRIDTETASPVTTMTADDLDKRGLTSVQAALHSMAANGAGALPNSYTSNGAFASGASAVSLRGLTTSSTLVLFNGLRASYYPLADDGTRNFVDLNTIPDAIIDRIEVLKDGASSTYGADAVAGVVNVITKKQIVGLSGRAEFGGTEKGGAGSKRFSTTYGFGDLADKGYNLYFSADYQTNDTLKK